MNEDNPPMLLPNGHVYSFEVSHPLLLSVRGVLLMFANLKQALQDMAAKQEGLITCPKTGDVFKLTDIKKVFVS